MLVALPVDTPGVKPDPRDALVISHPSQLPALLTRHPTIALYGEHDGLVFAGDYLDAAALASISFWWEARTC